jgi:hypothetical protein
MIELGEIEKHQSRLEFCITPLSARECQGREEDCIFSCPLSRLAPVSIPLSQETDFAFDDQNLLLLKMLFQLVFETGQEITSLHWAMSDHPV